MSNQQQQLTKKQRSFFKHDNSKKHQLVNVGNMPTASNSEGNHRTACSLPSTNDDFSHLPADSFEASSSSRSLSIPLPSSHVFRTQSELQLSIDQAVAEQRDANMFYRLVHGIRERNDSAHGKLLVQSENSIAGIIQTRFSRIDQNRAHQFTQSSSIMADYKSNDLRMLPTTTEHHASDDWSISGFDDSPIWSLSDVRNKPSLAHYVNNIRKERNRHNGINEDEIFDFDL